MGSEKTSPAWALADVDRWLSTTTHREEGNMSRLTSVHTPPRVNGTDNSRLSVNLAGDTMAVLKDLADRNGSTLSDTVRRAIAVLKYFDCQTERGHEIATIEDLGGGKTQVNRVILLG